jgi:hypothetical protein
MSDKTLEAIAQIEAEQSKTLEAIQSLKQLSDLRLEDIEAIQKRELEIIFEIEIILELNK